MIDFPLVQKDSDCLRSWVQEGQSFSMLADGKKWKRGCVRKPSARRGVRRA